MPRLQRNHKQCGIAVRTLRRKARLGEPAHVRARREAGGSADGAEQPSFLIGDPIH
jgi:hypothetical protein